MKTLLLITLSAFVFTVNSCSKSPKCWGKNKSKGDISELLRIPCQPLSGDRWVINSQDAYELTFDSSCSLPAIDFNQYTLLGLETTGECETKYIREVSSDNGVTHYEVKVKSCGICQKMNISYNWVTIPKIPDNATVTFEVIEK